jgi:hypothetical protein
VSSVLAIAGVTAVLRDLLDNALIDQVTKALGTGFSVSALAPDLIRLDDTSPPRLNLFLYQVTPNAGFRNTALPARDSNGRRVKSPQLALDLHYMLTAYASADLQAEVLLGYAMQLLHETPVLPREAIRTALKGPDSPVGTTMLPPVYRALRASDLADQLEQVKITPAVMNSEELSKLWTALQAHYRPTATYQVSVVLIDSVVSAQAALPVLARGMVDNANKRERGVVVQPSAVSPYAEIDDITPPRSQIAALLGDEITIVGRNFDGSGHTLLLSNARLGIDRQVGPATSVSSSTAAFVLSLPPEQLPAGTYTASLQLIKPGETQPRTTNEVALSVAPAVTVLDTVHVGPDGDATIIATCTPYVVPGQRVSLIVGDVELPAEPLADGPAPTATFRYPSAPTGAPPAWVRLRVDGVDSLIVDRQKQPPVFTGPQIVFAP